MDLSARKPRATWQALASAMRARVHAAPLPGKIMLALAIALLPLGMLALIAAYGSYSDLKRQQEQLAGTSLDALSQIIEARLQENLTTLQSALLANRGTPPRRADCRAALPAMGEFELPVEGVAWVNADGSIACAVGGRMIPDEAIRTSLARLESSGSRFSRYVVPPEGDESFGLLLAVRAESGLQPGAVFVALVPASAAGQLLRSTDIQAGTHVTLYARGAADTRRVIASQGKIARDLRMRVEDVATAAVEGRTIHLQGDKKQWLLTAKRLDEYGLGLALVTPGAALAPGQLLGIALPAVMWVTALAIGWLAIDRIVVAPLARMRRLVERYGAGERSIRLSKLDFGSQEMAELAQAFDDMATRIDSHEADMLDALTTQKRLTREVHHRVKNNLQIVSSLLSIQSREAPPDKMQVYSSIQQRVNALALVHRWLYDDEAMRGVDLRSLFHDLCVSLEQSLESSEHIHLSIKSDVDRLLVSQDHAVPLAFLVTEIVVCAARLAESGSLLLRLSAHPVDGGVRLQISAPTLRGDPLATARAGTSSRIVQGLSRQMRTALTFEPDSCLYEMVVPLSAASAGAQRASGTSSGGTTQPASSLAVANSATTT